MIKCNLFEVKVEKARKEKMKENMIFSGCCKRICNSNTHIKVSWQGT